MLGNIKQIIINELKEINVELKNPELGNPNEKTRLSGSKGLLDSLALVNLITAVEESVSDEYDIEIVLADERAMSQKRPPFRSVLSLSEYTLKLIEEEAG